jgi:phosphoenolpyruvate carboxykinase (ATP)
MIEAALSGALDDVEYRDDPVFGLHVPVRIEGIPEEVLDPRKGWDDKKAYDEQAAHLAGLFHENFLKYADEATEEIKAAGPLVGAAA